jgi:hypothetical protein
MVGVMKPPPRENQSDSWVLSVMSRSY